MSSIFPIHFTGQLSIDDLQGRNGAVSRIAIRHTGPKSYDLSITNDNKFVQGQWDARISAAFVNSVTR